MRRLIRLGALVTTLLLGAAACTYAPRYEEPEAWRYDYYYYPHVGDYFYRDRRSWVRVHVLPRHYVLDHRVRRVLVIKDEVPYRHHDRHQEHYRARSISDTTAAMMKPSGTTTVGVISSTADGRFVRYSSEVVGLFGESPAVTTGGPRLVAAGVDARVGAGRHLAQSYCHRDGAGRPSQV